MRTLLFGTCGKSPIKSHSTCDELHKGSNSEDNKQRSTLYVATTEEQENVVSKHPARSEWNGKVNKSYASGNRTYNWAKQTCLIRSVKLYNKIPTKIMPFLRGRYRASPPEGH
ncbi:hypothetical protein AHF37_07249 [Paragonimus kellicotti]|nr:hypothetical protein AHF37_07249 [Paragonimus kellicotti]